MHEILNDDLQYKIAYEFIEIVKLHLYAEGEKVMLSVSISEAQRS